MAYDYSKLQNGSDIRGIAIGSPAEPVNLDSEAVSRLAKGFLYLLSHNTDKEPNELCIAVGRDSRISGPELVRDIVSALTPYGVKVLDSGLSSSPAMFMSTVFEEFKCDGAIMVTASHMPSNRNGMKFFDACGGLDKGDIADIINFAESGSVLGRLIPKAASDPIKANLMDVYSAHLRKKIVDALDSGETPLSGLSITVDAGNGAGGFYAEKVLEVLGANTQGSQFLDPDGTFPNHIPNPDNKEAMESIKNQVLAVGADYGVIFDTDVDRAAVVTGDGELLNRNNLIAVLSVIAISEHPGTTIVTNSPTTEHLKRFITELGGHQYRYISGYRNVINKAIELNENGTDCQLAIETSGHAAFKENYFLDDGAYVVAKILMLLPRLIERGEILDHLIQKLVQPKEVVEVRFKIETEDFKTYGNEVIKEFPQWIPKDWVVNPENEEGVRINFKGEYGDGWLLLRMSLHEPLLVLQIENDLVGYQSKILETIQQIMNRYPKINQNKLEALLK